MVINMDSNNKKKTEITKSSTLQKVTCSLVFFKHT